jgi:uncharacterized phage protein (TIGR01671 family)
VGRLSREIKFRAWHDGGASYRYEPQMIYDESPGDCLVWKKQGQPLTAIMQYTGLKDRNGKEIYEGDVVRKIDIGFEERKNIEDLAIWEQEERVLEYKIDNEGFIDYRYWNHVDVVVFDRFPIYWLRNESFGYEGEDLISPSDCEVIGNIYENKELITHEST